MDQPGKPCLQFSTTRRAPNTLTVAVTGELDLRAVGELRTGLRESVASDATTVIEVDLSGVSFLDCAGIGALIGIRRDAAQSGAEVVIIAASAAVQRLLTLFDLDVAFGYRRPSATIVHRWWPRPTLFRRARTEGPPPMRAQPESETRLSA